MRCCVLIAGMPASGKTSFARFLAEELVLPMISKDQIKEVLYDTLGFSSGSEKAALGAASLQLLLYYADSLMQAGGSFILEDNFDERIKPGLQRLLEKHGYRPVTVRFGADAQVLYDRFVQRDATPQRHPGHIARQVYPEGEEQRLLACPITFEEFAQGALRRGISDFSLGSDVVVVDTTHFERVDYHAIAGRIRQVMTGRLWDEK